MRQAGAWGGEDGAGQTGQGEVDDAGYTTRNRQRRQQRVAFGQQPDRQGNCSECKRLQEHIGDGGDEGSANPPRICWIQLTLPTA